MKTLVLGGTSDSHKYIEQLNDDFYVSVATEYGYRIFSEKYGQKAVLIKFDEQSLKDFITDYSITIIADTTHPFAKKITALAVSVCAETGIDYINAMRSTELKTDYEKIYAVESYEEAAGLLTEKNLFPALLTTGSNRIEEFGKIAEKCFARVLPFEKSIEKCREAGFDYSKIIAMQGPFSEEFNTAMMKEIKAAAMVTKMSGKAGGIYEKIEACRKTEAACIIITGG